MKLETFFERFDQFADAPDAGAKIRELVLHLAVTGTLVEQDSSDQSAEVLLEEISSERLAAVKSGLISPMKPLSAVGEDELSFELRPGWAPARLNQLVLEIQTGPFGSSLHKSDYQRGGTPVINPASIKGGKIIPIDEMAVGERTLKRLEVFKLRAGDIVMARRGEMGRCAIVTNSEAGWLCGTGSLVLRMPRSTHPRYLAMLIGAPMARRYLGGASVGTTMQNLNQSILLRMPVGVPPLAEQKRIVAKVDELMALCDRLDAQQKERETRHAALARASLTRFADAPIPANLNFLFHKSYTISPVDLRKSILTLAVQGKLLPQYQTDESAEAAIAQLPALPIPARFEKRSRARIEGVGAMSIGPSSRLPPMGWSCIPLVQIAKLESGHTPSRSRTDWWNGSIPWVGLVDARLHNGRTIYETLQHTNEEGLANSAARLLPTGTVCVSRTASVGYVVILGRPMATSQDFVNWVPTPAVTSEWLRLVFTAEKDGFARFSKGAVHQTIYYPEWLSMYVMLPPVAEQHRVAAKVDQMMALVDELETQLVASRVTATKLLDAIVSELTA